MTWWMWLLAIYGAVAAVGAVIFPTWRVLLWPLLIVVVPFVALWRDK